eukprot:2034684-Alexandrium_andersonii.AAC.1
MEFLEAPEALPRGDRRSAQQRGGHWLRWQSAGRVAALGFGGNWWERSSYWQDDGPWWSWRS